MTTMTYMTVERPTIQKAFAVAHKASLEFDMDKDQRAKFREIAKLIWSACGEEGRMPPEPVDRRILSGATDRCDRGDT